MVTVSGLIYNLGLVVGPWFEGQLAQCLLGILNGNETFAAMAALCAGYLIAIAVVQGSRFIKRLYVRKFANNINRSMKQVLYANLVRKDKVELEQAGTGTLMTKAISDVDACAEGMRKFTTEIFDTGIALLAYAVMLLGYDWRLALLCLVFAPISYYIAEQMKTLVQRTGAANKESTGRLSAATLDRVSGALTYRVYGCEPQRDAAYEACLQDYERTAVKAGLPVAAMPPLYGVISMTGVLFIFTFGARNVAGTGWAAWDIAAFTTFLSCFGKLAVKSSHAAKLFNAVQKAQVSWGRIKPLMRQPDPLPEEIPAKPETLTVNKLGFAYRGGAPVLQDITFTAQPGRIFGITGAVACGKSTLGKAFLCELPYTGSIQYGGREMAGMTDAERCGVVGYLGHDPELLSDSIRNNILLGRDDDAWKYLRAVCLENEVKAMPNGLDTRVGDGGVRLSGGQQQRLALARLFIRPGTAIILCPCRMHHGCFGNLLNHLRIESFVCQKSFPAIISQYISNIKYYITYHLIPSPICLYILLHTPSASLISVSLYLLHTPSASLISASLYRSSCRIQFHDLQQLLRRRRHRHFRIPYNTELSLRYHFIEPEFKKQTGFHIISGEIPHHTAHAKIPSDKLYDHITGGQFKLRLHIDTVARKEFIHITSAAGIFLQKNKGQALQFLKIQHFIFIPEKSSPGHKHILDLPHGDHLNIRSVWKRSADDSEINPSLP